MKTQIAILIGAVLLGFGGGMLTSPQVMPAPSCPECPACPDVKCPEAVSLSLNRSDLGELRKLRITRSTIDQRITIQGSVILSLCDEMKEVRGTVSLDSLIAAEKL